MSALAALMLATPLFGFQLTPPTADPGLAFWPAMSSGAPIAALPLPAVLDVSDAGGDGLSDEDRRYAEEVRRRADLGAVHRAFGIATWGAMTITTILGFIQYYNLYGVAGTPREATPCVTGSAVFGQDQCSGTPWPHLIAALTTTALYTVTFSLSLIMPDPNDVGSGPGEFAERIRIHEALRWVHLVGMVAQTVIGVGLANGWFGDRVNNYGTLEVLAGVHQAIGWTTWGVLTAAGAMMIF